MSIFEPNIEQITISEQVAVISDERWSLVSQKKTFLLRNLCILNHQHCIKASGKRTSLEPLQVKHAQSRPVADISDAALWSASYQTDCKYFERITSSEFIFPTKVCFKRHSVKCFYVANVQSPLQSSNWSANILNLNITISDHANFDLRPIFWVQREFVTASCKYSAQVAQV